MLFTTPLVHNLRLEFPQSTIVYLSNRRTSTFLEKNSDINQVMVYERDEFVAVYRQSPIQFAQKWMELFSSLKQQRFDLVFDFSLNSTFGFLSFAGGIKKRVGFDYRKRGRFLTDKISIKGFEGKHVIEHYLELLGLVNVPVKSREMKLDIPKDEMQWAENWIKEYKIDRSKPLIAVMPGGGASWGKAARNKRWPAVKYADLIDKIVEKFDAAIILLGDNQEEELCREVAQLAHVPLYLAVGETSVLGLAALLKSCRMAVLNDGGPLHVAVASGTKTVSIFGPVDPHVYGPYPPQHHRLVQKNLACQPCYRNFRQARCNHINCLATLSVEEVYRKVQEIL